MSDVSTIEWTDSTWNVVTGCTRVSPGCAHCYIERTPPFRMAGRRFERDGDGSSTGLVMHPERLRKVPKGPRIFVNSLSDLFHEEIPDPFICDVFDVMAMHPHKIFQVLTKRPERALEWFRNGWTSLGKDGDSGGPIVPLPNVWIGVSIENARFTWRADVLREIPAAVRFISAEPLLGSLFELGTSAADVDGASQSAGHHESVGERQGRQPGSKAPLDLEGIDWVIVGGESGPGARPMHPDWVRELRDASRARGPEGMHGWRDAETAFFFKQWGEWAPYTWSVGDNATRIPLAYLPDGPGRWLHMRRFRQKKLAGRELDGRTWDEMPAVFADRAAA